MINLHPNEHNQKGSLNMNGAGQKSMTMPEWLLRSVTPAQVRNELQQQIPEFASGERRLISCEFKRLRLGDGQDCWHGVYHLDIEYPLGNEPQTVALNGRLIPPYLPEPVQSADRYPFGDDAWTCYVPNLRLELSTRSHDTQLAALPQLTDPEAARSFLEETMRSSLGEENSNVRIRGCRPKVMRYKPGSRCTVLYHLDYEAPVTERTWPHVVVAKTYRGEKGKIAYDGMKALWESPLGASSNVTIAEPLAYLSESNVLVQGPIAQEMTLKEFVRTTRQKSGGRSTGPEMDELIGYIRQTAAGLAELHQCGVRTGEIVTWEDELADLYARRDRLAAPVPEFTDWFEALLTHLQEVAATHVAGPLAPAHQSFRPAQVLLAKGEIGFIDFDGFCQAEPALDLALFMTTIKNIAVNKPNSSKKSGKTTNGVPDPVTRQTRLMQADLLNEVFLTEYERHAPVSRTRIMLWETLQLLSLEMGSWTKLKFARLGNCQFMIEQHLQRYGLD